MTKEKISVLKTSQASG